MVTRQMQWRESEQAVSPVIGVILMVALTVILAAIIAAFVFGITDEVSSTRIVAGTALQPDAVHIDVTYRGGQDAPICTGVIWRVTPESGAAQAYTMGSILPTAPALTVGTVHRFNGNFGGRDHVVATAYFVDGNQQVVLDTII